MKNFATILVALLLVLVQQVSGQQANISQHDLPYEIPVIEPASSSENIQYRWLENDKEIVNTNAPFYTIPAGKPSGTYIYVHQVKCASCTDWLSSNSFTVTITTAERGASARVLNANLSATFSPQQELEGYLDHLISVIDESEQSLDISLYSFEDYDVYQALERAADRGVEIRMLYEGALEDRNESDSTVSHKLEEVGIDVKYVNKTNHHKFVIADNDYLVTSSGNWNEQANSVYNENTLWVNDEELVTRYRAEFEYLWNFSREFGASYSWPVVNPDSLISQITDNPDVDVVFSSSNYRTYISSTYGSTFAKISGNQKVADRIVELIEGSQNSIKLAANHLRSRPISEALIAKKILDPDIDIQVYLDGQEYVTEGYNNYQIAERDSCLAGATTEGQIRDCVEKNFYYSYELIQAGIDVRFKLYAYSWHHNTAALMHHKYAIFDDSVVATGSYNYSYNAETNSMENVVIFNSNASASTVLQYVDSFDEIWNTGNPEGFYDDIITHINSDSRYIPVLFPSVSLSHSEVTFLKEQIETACPTVTDEFFKDNKEYYVTFLRDVSLSYDAEDRISNAQSTGNGAFTSTYTYSGNDEVAGVTFLGNDGTQFTESYIYDSQSNLTTLNSPLFDLSLTYSNGELATLDAGRGAHSWINETNTTGTLSRYSVPGVQDYITVQWDENGLPVSTVDADARSITWDYDDGEVLSSITTTNRTIQFMAADSQFDIVTSDGEGISVQVRDVHSLDIVITGTVAANIGYSSVEQPDKSVVIDIDLTSTNIASGSGKNAQIQYVLDPYGRVAGAGDLVIAREPYTGNITSITNNQVVETRAYNDWELLTEKTVLHGDSLYYKATYQYDALQRITQTTEIVLGDTSLYQYVYNASGQLQSVTRDSVLTEEYTYDAHGNWLSVSKEGLDYAYNISILNRLDSYTWEASGTTRIVDFAYNASGQLTGN